MDSEREEACENVDTYWCADMLYSVLQDPRTHDVTFKTSDGELVGAHKMILAASSPVFYAMLCGEMKESGQKEIDLPNIDSATLQMLLLFMYTGHIKSNVEKCCYLLQAARYFAIDELIDLCSDTIGDALDIDNYSSVTEFAAEHDYNMLLERCITFLEAKAKKVICNEGFFSLPLSVMLAFTSSYKLKVGELSLFLAVVEWCKHQKEKLTDDEINSVFKQIRYPLIRKTDLLSKVLPTGKADSDLYKAALNYHNGVEYDGPEEQLELRSYCFYFKNECSSELRVVYTPSGTLIKKIGPPSELFGDMHGSSANLQICPTEDNPILFDVVIKQCTDKAKIKFSFFYEIDYNNHSAQMNASHIPLGKEVGGSVFIRNQRVYGRIGNRSMSVPIDDDRLEFFVTVYHHDDQILLYLK